MKSFYINLFSALRLSLICNANGMTDAQNLVQALYGILMLLPQTEAFNILKNRLQCVPNYMMPTTGR